MSNTAQIPPGYEEAQKRRQRKVVLMGGPYDGHVRPIAGFQLEVPALSGDFEFWVYQYEEIYDPDLPAWMYYAKWPAQDQGWDGVTRVPVDD
jgi:hypothetical protein